MGLLNELSQIPVMKLEIGSNNQANFSYKTTIALGAQYVAISDQLVFIITNFTKPIYLKSIRLNVSVPTNTTLDPIMLPDRWNIALTLQDRNRGYIGPQATGEVTLVPGVSVWTSEQFLKNSDLSFSNEVPEIIWPEMSQPCQGIRMFSHVFNFPAAAVAAGEIIVRGVMTFYEPKEH